jgi:hypothetical protein
MKLQEIPKSNSVDGVLPHHNHPILTHRSHMAADFLDLTKSAPKTAIEVPLRRHVLVTTHALGIEGVSYIHASV